ncbi:hypothetical protein ASE23_27820 [Rhizobium sp. Root73]|nr:hypothetical protein ASE23_27820 [Rhizobium sp. Root73]
MERMGMQDQTFVVDSASEALAALQIRLAAHCSKPNTDASIASAIHIARAMVEEALRPLELNPYVGPILENIKAHCEHELFLRLRTNLATISKAQAH